MPLDDVCTVNVLYFGPLAPSSVSFGCDTAHSALTSCFGVVDVLGVVLDVLGVLLELGVLFSGVAGFGTVTTTVFVV